MRRAIIFLFIFSLPFLYSDDFWDYFDIGYDYYNEQDYSRAVQYFEMAYNFNPDNFNVNLMLSVSHFYLNEFEDAEFYCNNALAINPDDESSKRMLSAILIAKMGDFEFKDQATGDYITNEHVVDKSCIYIEDIPLFIDRGVLEVRGTRLSNASSLYFVIGLPSGWVEFPEADWYGDDFSLKYNFSQRGTYTLEIVASHVDTGGKPVVIAEICVDTEGPVEYKIFPDYPITSIYQAERDHLREINDIRRSFGVQPIIWDQELSDVARGHSEVCAAHNIIAHNTPWDGTPWDRLQAAGLAGAAENVGAGLTVGQSMTGLYRSPAHRASLINSNNTRIGIGCAQADNGLYIFTILLQ